MTVFKQALQTLKEHPEIIESIEENITTPQIINPIYKEEIINGYKVSYAYEKVKEKAKNGDDGEHITVFIYSVENLFTKNFIQDDAIYQDIMKTLQEKL